MKKLLLLLTFPFLVMSFCAAQNDFEVTHYPGTYNYVKTVHTTEAHWAVFQNMLWRIDRETSVFQLYHITDLITGTDQFGLRNFTDAAVLQDGRAIFFTSNHHYFIVQDGQISQHTNYDLVYPKIYKIEGDQFHLSLRFGLTIGTFDLTTGQVQIEQVAGDEQDYSRRVIHIDQEGYQWIASFNQGHIRRHKDGQVEVLTDQFLRVDYPSYICHITADDQLGVWWDDDAIYMLHNGQWTTADLTPYNISIYRSECTADNSMLLYGARKVLKCSIVDGQAKVEDISDQYSTLELASIQLSDDENPLYFQKSTQELWQHKTGELPQKIGALDIAPIYNDQIKKDPYERLWCLGYLEPYLLIDDQWTGLRELFPVNMDRIIDLVWLDDYQPLVIQVRRSLRTELLRYNNGQWQLLNPESEDANRPSLRYQRIYRTEQGDIWAVDPRAGFSLYRDGQRVDFQLTDFFPSPGLVHDLHVNQAGQLLVSTNLGLYTIEENGSYEFLSFQDLGIEVVNTIVRVAQFDEEGAWWVNVNAGIYRYHNGVLTEFPAIELPEPLSVFVTGIFPFGTDDIWATLNSQVHSLAHYDEESWTFLLSEDYNLPFMLIHSVEKESAGTYWVSGLHGVYKFRQGVDQSPPSERDGAFMVFPNPTCCTFTVEWEQEAGEVNLSLYNVLGQPVRELMQRSTEAGRYRQSFSRHDLENGTYFLQIREGDRSKAIPLIIH